VERQSRFVCAAKTAAITAEAAWRRQYGTFSLLPAHAVASVTADNGSEFVFHHKLADTMAVPTYFCDPYSSFQRGTNEHFKGHIRRYLPKGKSFHDVTQEELGEYAKEIDNRPRKVSRWSTPAEVFHELRSKGTITSRVALRTRSRVSSLIAPKLLRCKCQHTISYWLANNG